MHVRTIIENIDRFVINPLRLAAEKIASPCLDLGIRLYIAAIFFKSGLERFHDYWHYGWDDQVAMFVQVHPIPGLEPGIAAMITVIAELILSPLLVLGMFTRFAMMGIFIMALMMYWYHEESYLYVLWMVLATISFIKGPGIFSADYLLLKWVRGEELPKPKRRKRKQ